ncbi:MAG: capsular biosynthesis protein [Betaproteobacteria bacterium]|jgi:protein-tyrosine kinase|nr:capsular biosynthesis protein [Betaproteobacteria bacterium]
MAFNQRPRFGQSARKVQQEASVFSPFNPTESTLGQLSEEAVMRKGRMGDAFIKSNRLTKEQVEAIVRLQKERGMRFGEAAVKLGLLSSNEVEDVLDKQFNFNTPSGRRTTGFAPSLAIIHSPYSEEAEGIRRLRTQILNKIGDGQHIALAILSPLKREGKSHIAASLAVAFAQLNIHTMLIDGNMRSPTLHKIFGIPNQTGLSTMLAQRSPKTMDQLPSVMPNLWLLGSGPPPPNPIEILSSPNFSKLLDRFSSDIAVFIVDTPAATIWADGETIARQTGRALIVGRENFTKLSDLKTLNRDISGVGVEMLGTVYNQPPKSMRGTLRAVWTQMTSPFRRRRSVEGGN